MLFTIPLKSTEWVARRAHRILSIFPPVFCLGDTAGNILRQIDFGFCWIASSGSIPPCQARGLWWEPPSVLLHKATVISQCIIPLAELPTPERAPIQPRLDQHPLAKNLEIKLLPRPPQHFLPAPLKGASCFRHVSRHSHSLPSPLSFWWSVPEASSPHSWTWSKQQDSWVLSCPGWAKQAPVLKTSSGGLPWWHSG